jgi:BASS family bile acid:Na+ symporter
MQEADTWPGRLAHAVHHHLIWLVVASYAAAAILPAPGLWLRGVSFGHSAVSLPAVMLSLLLFNAGLGVKPGHLRGLFVRPGLLLTGLAANLLVPLVLVLALAGGLVLVWHDPQEAQCVLVGLALVAAMPVAGSSTAWSQNADGDLALSLGLVLGSTLLSPFTAPAVFWATSLMGSGEYAERLDALAGQGTGLFLASYVLLPSLLGLLCRRAVGEETARAALPLLKIINAANLLVLCYANAAVSLPEALSNPDPDFLAVMLAAVVALCVAAFAAGWLIARLLGADVGQRNALMFGLGMNNNGTGLVLAALVLAPYPRVMQPVILYNLVQHLVAAYVSWTIVPPAEQATEGSNEAVDGLAVADNLGHLAKPRL